MQKYTELAETVKNVENTQHERHVAVINRQSQSLAGLHRSTYVDKKYKFA